MRLNPTKLNWSCAFTRCFCFHRHRPSCFSCVNSFPSPLIFAPTSPLLSILWHRLFITCRNDLLMPSGKFTQPYLHLSCGLQRKCNPLHALSRKHKWIIYGALGSAENPLVWSKCHACSLFSPFLVVVLKVSFDRTLVAELTPETLLKTTAFPLRAGSWRLCFSLAFHKIF